MYERTHLRDTVSKWEKEDELWDEEGNPVPPPKRDHRSPEFARANAQAMKGLLSGPRMSRGREASARRRRSR
jgi:hypothetical protein